MSALASWPADWLRPQWPAPPHVRAVFTSRAGGVSQPPFDQFNLGDHVRDNLAAVAENRTRLAQALNARPVFLQQVHGTTVIEVHAQTQPGLAADACWTAACGVACTVMVADCLPLLLCDTQGRWVAAAHAGWRGLAGPDGAGGVVETTWRQWLRLYQQRDPNTTAQQAADQTLVWLGPCIGPHAFEVGAEVREAFVRSSSAAVDYLEAVAGTGNESPVEKKFTANLSGLARQRLAALGVHQVFGNDGSLNWCTATQASRFFSHRRDAIRLGSTGRMAACVWRV